MSLEQAILDRLEKRNGQIAQLQSMVHALERAADSQREHATMERGRLLEENKQLAAQIKSDENVSQLNREHAQYQIASLTAEVARLRAEVPLESTREGLKNAVAKLQEVTTDRDRVLNELAAIVAEANKTGRCGGDPVALLKQGQVDRDTAESLDRQLGAALALSNERAQEIRKLIDGHAEDMKAQAEVQSKYESILTKTTDLVSYAMTIGRKEGEPLEMFMERQALRLAALEAAITAAKCDELAKATARIKPLEALYKTLKGWQENDHIIGYGLTIDTAINKATEALSQLTA